MKIFEIKGEFVGGPVNSPSRVFSGNSEDVIEEQKDNFPVKTPASDVIALRGVTEEVVVAETLKEE